MSLPVWPLTRPISPQGGGATARTANVSDGTTGVVATVPTGLKAPITVTRESGSAAISFSASGSRITISIAAALAVGSSLSAIAKAVQADGAGVLVPVTLTGVAGSGGGGGSTPVAGSERADWASLLAGTAAEGVVPLAYYHPGTETVTEVDGRLTGVSSNSLSPALTPSATGPKVVTYANGIKAWRSDGTEFLDGPTSWTANPRDITIFMVARFHKRRQSANFFAIGYQSDGVTPLAGGATFRTSGASNTAPFMFGAGIASSGSTVNKNFMACGARLQVLGIASRTTANGGTKFWNNKRASSTLAQSGVTTTGTRGFRIFGYPSSNGTTNGLDMTEMVVFAGLTDAQAQAVADKLSDRWERQEITKVRIYDGDSVTDGITEVLSGDNLAMVLTEPGTDYISEDMQVYNFGISGAKVEDLILRRDAANGWQALKIGTNVNDNELLVQIGRNDTAAYMTGGDSAAVAASKTYADILAYHNAATVGTVALGFKVTQYGNIACDAGATGTDLRNLILANFTTDVPSGRVVDLQQIVDSAGGAGRKPFAQVPDTRDGIYYQDNDGSLDTTHPSIYGTRVMTTGGDTRQYGCAA